MTLRNEPALRKYYYVGFKQTYEELGDGLVRVTDKDGREGVFHCDGRYVEGELTHCNLHMLVWTGGADPPRGLQLPLAGGPRRHQPPQRLARAP